MKFTASFLVLLTVVICITKFCYAQELPVVVPNSPEVSEFMKYGDTSVSMYTGKPNITIPIYTINGREYSMPITLNYDAGGIKVTQIATQVGLGWSLQAGGMISRVVNGKPDHVDYSGHCDESYYTQYDKIKAFYDTPNPQRSDFSRNSNGIDLSTVANTYFPANPLYHPTLVSYFLFQDEILEGRVDTQPDTYSFNVGNLSGEIYIDPVTGKAICTNGKNYKINYTGNLSNYEGGGIASWHIIDELGTQYFFTVKDKTKTQAGDLDASNISQYTSSWKLTKIISANKKDTLQFSYSFSDFWINEKFVPRYNTSLQTLVNPVDVKDGCPNNIGGSSNNSNPYKLTEHYLSAIRINGDEEISFLQSSVERKDLPSRHPLAKIVLANGLEWRLHQSYFKSSSNLDLNSVASLIEDDLRLKLDSISIRSNVSGVVKNEYSFDYFNPNAMPNRQSFSQDYWGFYNGKTNSSLIPKETVQAQGPVFVNGMYPLVNVTLPGADRNPSLEHTKNGTLKRITHPTGGYTEFEYDLNTTSYVGTERTFKTELVGVGSLFGGKDNTSSHGPYDYWDDEFTVDSPKGTEIVVPIYESGLKNIQIQYRAPKIPALVDGIVFVALLKCGGVPQLDECGNPVTNPTLNECPRNLDWEGIVNYPTSNKMFVRTYVGGRNDNAIPDYFAETIPVVLEEGYYKLYILNGVPGSNLEVSNSYDTYELSNEPITKAIGGLRVTETRDYLKENTPPVLTKKYDYTKNIYTPCNGLYNVSSGVEHFKPIYSDFLLKYIMGPFKDLGKESCAYLNRFSYPLNAVQSPHIGYSQVKEFYLDKNQKSTGSKEYKFYNEQINTDNIGYTPYLKSNFKNGTSKEISSFNTSGRLQQKIENRYSETRINSSIHAFKTTTGKVEDSRAGLLFYEKDNGEQVYVNGGWKTAVYKVTGGHLVHQRLGTQYEYINTRSLMLDNYLHLDETITTNYYENGSETTQTNYYYDGLTQLPKTHRQVTRVETTNSKGEIIKSKISYPDDVTNRNSLGNNALTTENFSAIDLLKNNNRVAVPLQKETTVENSTGTVLSKTIQRTNYKDFGRSLILPENIQSSKNNAALEDRITYHRYDSKGNLTEVSKASGAHSAYIWGYNNKFPIAKIDNYSFDAPLSELAPTDAALLSEADDDRTMGYTGNEGLLRQALDNLRKHRNLIDAQVTTYTYDPLIGVTSITDPKGYTVYYEYDGFNRLKHIKDHDGNILEAYEYNYKNE